MILCYYNVDDKFSQVKGEESCIKVFSEVIDRKAYELAQLDNRYENI